MWSLPISIRYRTEGYCSESKQNRLFQRSPTQYTLDFWSRCKVLLEGRISGCFVLVASLFVVTVVVVVEESCFVEQEVGKDDQSRVAVQIMRVRVDHEEQGENVKLAGKDSSRLDRTTFLVSSSQRLRLAI